MDVCKLLSPEELRDLNISCDYRPCGNVDKDQYEKDLTTFCLMGIGGIVICILGIIGNALSLAVLSRKSMRLSTHSYLFALSLCDLIVLVFTTLLLLKDLKLPVECSENVENNIDDDFHVYIFRFVHPCAFTFQVTSIWLTLAFTVDRYIMICHPFKSEPFCTISRARKVIAALITASIIFNIPKWFEYKTVESELGNLRNDLTDFGHDKIFKVFYHTGFYIVLVCGLPFLALAVLNSCLWHQVRLSRKRGREICADDKKRNDTTIMLIGIVVVFFICQMPALVSRTIWALIDDPYRRFNELPLYVFNEICTFLIVLNSAINIVPYYFFGKKFRSEFWKMMCSCCLQYPPIQKLTRSYSITHLENPNAVGAASRNHSVVSSHLLNTRNLNNGTRNSVTLSVPLVSVQPPSSHADSNEECLLESNKYDYVNGKKSGEGMCQSNNSSEDSAIVIVDSNGENSLLPVLHK